MRLLEGVRWSGWPACAVCAGIHALLTAGAAAAQQRAEGSEPHAAAIAGIDSLVAVALAVSPEVRAARDRVDAARARIAPSGTLPDPMLGLGVMNLPVAEPGYGDMMTMNTIVLGQMLPFPGKLSLARRATEHELRASESRLAATRLDVAARVRAAYYELAYLDHALEVLESNQRLLVNLIGVTESRYGVGTGGQQDVLKARVEAARIAEGATTLTEARRAALARLNAVLDRPSEAPLPPARVPERIARAAVAADPAAIRFISSSLGARAADSPLLPLEELQELAVHNNPQISESDALIAAQVVRRELARKAHLPDFDVSVQYGQRMERADMVSVMVSVPVPLRRVQRQEQMVAESRAELAALEADRQALMNRVRAEVADLYSRIEGSRAQLALFVRSVIPQGRAALESATAAFQVGRADFMTLIENQATLHEYETAYFRVLADFAIGVAELERIVGTEVLR